MAAVVILFVYFTVGLSTTIVLEQLTWPRLGLAALAHAVAAVLYFYGFTHMRKHRTFIGYGRATWSIAPPLAYLAALGLAAYIHYT